MRYRLLAVAAAATLMTVAPLSPASAATTKGCPPAGGWFAAHVGDVIDGIEVTQERLDPYDRNGDGTVCAKIVPAPVQDLPNDKALGAIYVNVIDNRVGATS